MSALSWRAVCAELIGSAALLALVVGSGIMGEQLSAGNTALALLANSLATGAGLFVLIMLFGPLSGAHFNPAVSLMARLQQQIGNYQFAAHIIAQVVGAILGVWLAHLMFDLSIWQTSLKQRTGSALWSAEFVATFGLLLTIQGACQKSRQLPLAAVAAMVALYITAAYWFTASTSFANPAVTIARSLSNTFAGIHPESIAGFVLAQLAACLIATWFGKYLFAETAVGKGNEREMKGK